MGEPISHSVGQDGRNHRHDVLVIQLLLNNHLTALGPRPRLNVDGFCGHMTIDAITAYQQRELHMTHPDGLVYPRGRTLRSLLTVATVKHGNLVKQVHKIQKLQSPSLGPVANVTQVAPLTTSAAAASPSADAHATPGKQLAHKYTDSPLEMVKTRTLVSPLTLPDLLQRAWPGLNADGARLITAQYMGETGGGKSCWNYNLGNVKCTETQRRSMLHQYLPGTWEYWSADVVAAYIKRDPSGRYATRAEIVAKEGTEAPGMKVIFFDPPNIQTCFRAYKDLNDGVIDWTNRYKRMAQQFPDLLGQLNNSDYAAFAKVLKKKGYYSQAEGKYAASMKQHKEDLDKTLGKK